MAIPLRYAASVLLGTLLGSAALAQSQSLETRIGPIELQSGYPSDASVKKLYDELDFQRAVQAYIWATPLVASEAMRVSFLRDWGADFNTVVVVDQYSTPANKALTANNTTIYSAVLMDLGRDGPMVVEAPEGVYGVIDDFWERPVVEVGPFGPDKAKGGKFLLLPPGYTGEAPSGYFAAHALANRLVFLGRAFVKGDDVGTAVKTQEKVQIYPLSQAVRGLFGLCWNDQTLGWRGLAIHERRQGQERRVA